MSRKIEARASLQPQEYDPDLERICDHNSCYITIARPKRDDQENKPGRLLTFLSPNLSQLFQQSPEIAQQLPAEVLQLDELRYAYLMEIRARSQAGDHLHVRKKVELFCPVVEAPLHLYLQNIQTGEKRFVVLSSNSSLNYEQFLVPTGVAHTIVNPTGIPLPYLVLSNIREKEALTIGDVVSFPLDLSTFQND